VFLGVDAHIYSFTHTHTHRDTHMYTDTHTQTQTHTDTQTHIHTHPASPVTRLRTFRRAQSDARILGSADIGSRDVGILVPAAGSPTPSHGRIGQPAVCSLYIRHALKREVRKEDHTHVHSRRNERLRRTANRREKTRRGTAER
jgi:hypothetical protein